MTTGTVLRVTNQVTRRTVPVVIRPRCHRPLSLSAACVRGDESKEPSEATDYDSFASDLLVELISIFFRDEEELCLRHGADLLQKWDIHAVFDHGDYRDVSLQSLQNGLCEHRSL